MKIVKINTTKLTYTVNPLFYFAMDTKAEESVEETPALGLVEVFNWRKGGFNWKGGCLQD